LSNSNLHRLGGSTVIFPHRPGIAASAAVVGPKEGKGPLGTMFDLVVADPMYGQTSYEEAEHAIFREACRRCCQKAGIALDGVQMLLGGDLLNQIMAASLAARELAVPFLGLYGACSTMAESLILGAILADGGYASPVLCAAGSHFCTAERQYRFPLEYGGQRSMAAQWTVTGTGACLIKSDGAAMAHIGCATIGRVVDMGVSDASNMGAAMAPAACDTLLRHFADTGTRPEDYDAIVTGDLGRVGSDLLTELLKENGVTLTKEKHIDCGLEIFNPADDVHAGGSGCGCSASVLAARLLPRVHQGEWKKFLFMATGALISPTINQQGETIPGIAHAVVIEGGK